MRLPGYKPINETSSQKNFREILPFFYTSSLSPKSWLSLPKLGRLYTFHHFILENCFIIMFNQDPHPIYLLVPGFNDHINFIPKGFLATQRKSPKMSSQHLCFFSRVSCCPLQAHTDLPNLQGFRVIIPKSPFFGITFSSQNCDLSRSQQLDTSRTQHYLFVSFFPEEFHFLSKA